MCKSVYVSIWERIWNILTLTRTKVATITATKQQTCIFVCEFFVEKWLIQPSKQKINIKLHTHKQTPRHSQWLSVIVINIFTTVNDYDSECVLICAHTRAYRAKMWWYLLNTLLALTNLAKKKKREKNQTKKILWAQHTSIIIRVCYFTSDISIFVINYRLSKAFCNNDSGTDSTLVL